MPDFCPIVEASPNPYTQIPTQVCERGMTFVNMAKYSQKGYWLFMQNAARANAVALNANGPGIGAMTPPADSGAQGDTELHKLRAASTGAFAVQPYLQSQDRYLSNGPVESTLIFGYPELDGRLPQPIFLPATNSLIMNLTDLSGSSNSVAIVAEGMQIVDPQGTLGVSPQQMREFYYRASHPYWLTFDSGPQVVLSANEANNRQLLTIPSNADFNCWWIVARATSPSGLTVDIKEGQRRSLLNSPGRADLIMSFTRSVTGMPGNLIPAASLPPVMQFTHLFQRGTAIEILLTDTSGAQNTVSIALAGQLVYDAPSTPGMAVRMPMAYQQYAQQQYAVPTPGATVQPGMAGLGYWGR